MTVLTPRPRRSDVADCNGCKWLSYGGYRITKPSIHDKFAKSRHGWSETEPLGVNYTSNAAVMEDAEKQLRREVASNVR